MLCQSCVRFQGKIFGFLASSKPSNDTLMVRYGAGPLMGDVLAAMSAAAAMESPGITARSSRYSKNRSLRMPERGSSAVGVAEV